jgi:response regulator RpfG family c-di-GMP phosphodiesterase
MWKMKNGGWRLGAVDYITKPISPPVVLARVKIHLALKAHADFLRDKSDFLEAEVSKRTREVLAIQDVTILAMATLAETRDLDTGNHIRRTQHYVKALAQQLSHAPSKFASPPDGQLHPDAVQVGTPARHWQSGHSGPHPAQTGALRPRKSLRS